VNRRKSHVAKVAAKEDRKVLRRRILQVLQDAGSVVIAGRVTLRDEVIWRVAGLVRELEATR
jgi:ABC-type hemin transport system substrate-binding protein